MAHSVNDATADCFAVVGDFTRTERPAALQPRGVPRGSETTGDGSTLALMMAGASSAFFVSV
jgi:hypothetical protein